ncbi:MAG: acetoin utilization protein AcuC [Rhodospirillales bacterium]|nr:acetoin utilization protein AcuC [Rhodospirillales bacterium]
MDAGVRFIGSDIYRRSRYGSNHPLAIPRVSTCIDLCRTLGWLPEGVYIDSPTASPEELTRFHDRDYVDALRAAEAAQAIDEASSARFNIGRGGNPVFGEVFRRPATACGASLLAAELLAAGVARTVYSPAGGTHHGRKGQASGFCYLNDPVLAILRLIDRGVARVAYVDIDAHHCDGVETALGSDPRVLIASIHEAGRWPNTGPFDEAASPTLVNLPTPAGLNDTEFALLFEEVVVPAVVAFAPEVIVVQGGADALADDPLSQLGLSNNALWRAVHAIHALGRPILVTGGGGYNPWSVARAWTGIWATLAGHDIPDRLPATAETMLRALHWHRRRDQIRPESWFTTLRDAPCEGPIRDSIADMVLRSRRRIGLAA